MAKAISWRATPLSLLSLRALVSELSGEPAALLFLVAVGVISHGLNMFQYPSFTGIDDEGIYTSQAWAILREGQLSPYTYVYDHVPGGWILLAAWMAVSGGPHAFGAAIDSGRVLMLLLHVASLVMLYRIARKLGCSVPIAIFGSLLFTLSPLALNYQRRLLLDNIALFWGLLSLDLLLDGWGRLSRVTLSGVCFGVALLTKETAVFLLLPMAFIAWLQRWQHQARFALMGWLLPMGVVVSWYPLYAALKGELFPAGGAVQFSTSGYGNTGVSLFDALLWQIGRDGGGVFNFDNQFWTLVRTDWLNKDAFLLAGGCLAIALNLVRGLRRRSADERRAFATGLLGLLPMLYLARGGIVFDFYILAAVPFLCLNIAILTAHVARGMRERFQVFAVCTAIALLGAAYVQSGALPPLYHQTPSTAGRDALAWIKSTVPADAFVIVRDDLWTDLREPGPGAAPGFANVQSYTKVAGDPAIREGVFADDWHNVDYLVTSPGYEQALSDMGNTIALNALQHAHRVQEWQSFGSNLELWKVDKSGASEAGLLQASAAYLSNHFEHSGAYQTSDGSVTSESEAYALLRAAWTDNRPEFTRVWRWTKLHLLTPDGVLAWHWNGTIVDLHSASDADTDTALALLMAGRRWSDPSLLADGTDLVHAIWAREVAQASGRAYMIAGDWATGADVLAINPSYFAPYAYHVFQEVDPEDNWLGLIDSGYQLLFESSAAALGSTQSAGLPPDWIGVDRASGELRPLAIASAGATTTYGYDAPRTYWRVALDLSWDADGRAATYLDQAGFLRDEVSRSGVVRAVYAHDGSVTGSGGSVVGDAGALAALLTLDVDSANRLYASEVLGAAQMTNGEAHWSDPSDLYAQEWGWFATALYAGTLHDTWHEV